MFKKAIKKIARTVQELFFGIFWYARDLIKYKRMFLKAGAREPIWLFPEIFDKNPASHSFDKHYVYMDRWAFKKLMANRPREHVDVGSSIRFLSMVSSTTKLKFVDIRPVSLDFDNFECVPGDILKLPFADNSVESLSCLHVAEHIGLGRYGDPLDIFGTAKACRELARVLKPGGRLYFAMPVGRPATYFNAFRVHSSELVLKYFQNLKMLEFAAVNDQGHFVPGANPDDYKNALYACGMFEFTK